MRKKEGSQGVGAGVGYVSVMLIFAIICLTIFAFLSLKAASSDDSINERSGEFLKQYYIADTLAKEKLSKLNDFAFETKYSDFFDDEFEERAKSIDGVIVQRMHDGISASYTVEINERQELAVKIVFDDNGKYTIDKWQSRMVEGEDSDSHINVWDGSF